VDGSAMPATRLDWRPTRNVSVYILVSALEVSHVLPAISSSNSHQRLRCSPDYSAWPLPPDPVSSQKSGCSQYSVASSRLRA